MKPEQGEGSRMWTRNPHERQQAKRRHGEGQSWTLRLTRQLSEGQNDRKAMRDKKTRRQRPGNKTFVEKEEEEKNTRENHARKRQGP